MGLGVGLQGVTSTTRFGELMRRLGRGRIGGLTSLAPTTGGIVGAVLGGVLSQHLGIEAGFLLLAVAHGADVRGSRATVALGAAIRVFVGRSR